VSQLEHTIIPTAKGFELQAIRDGKVVATVTWSCRRDELSLADIAMVTWWFEAAMNPDDGGPSG
jgi:hypothetical protein